MSKRKVFLPESSSSRIFSFDCVMARKAGKLTKAAYFFTKSETFRV